MNLIVLGAPGAGKGTQAVFLAKRFGLNHISTGDMLREKSRQDDSESLEIRTLMERGQLVPDCLISSLVKDRIAKAEAKNGYILDGFPRNLAQAEMLRAMTSGVDRVIQIVVDDEVIVKRMSGRRMCKACGATFHTFYHPPRKEDACDVCGEELVQRADDKAATVRERLRVYHEMTAPVVDYYDNQGLLLNVSGVGRIEDIFEEIVSELRM